MDRELAGAVMQRWADGEAVYEGTLYKAAAAMGLDPDLALLEARYFTALDHFLLEKRAMTEEERIIFSAAAGFESLGGIEKTASIYRVDPDRLILRTLQERNWIPNLSKLAMMMAGAQDAMAAGGGQDDGSGGMAPQPDTQVQQQPDARAAGIKPSPTAPEQMPPGPGGNLQDLLAAASQAPSAEMGGGLPPSGMPADEPPPPPPSATEKIQMVMPELDPDSASRYAQKLEELEDRAGLPVSDPQQVQKFIQTLQKSEKKIVDQAIKTMAEEQEQQIEMQMGQANSFQALRQQQAAGGGAPGGGAPGGAPAPQPDAVGAAPAPGGEPPAPAPGGGLKLKKPAASKPAPDAASMQKVASAAQALRNASRR